MPVVSRSDCTQIDLGTYTTIVVEGQVVTEAHAFEELEFNACEGIEEDNDLLDHYKLLVEEGLATETGLEILEETLVGEDNCPDAIDDFLSRRRRRHRN